MKFFCLSILVSSWLNLCALARDYPAHVVRAIDGDTIICTIDLGLGSELKLQRVRFTRINAPEKGEPGWAEARAYLVARIVDRDIILHTKGKSERDAYGRILASVEIEGADVGAELLAKKLAVNWR